MRPEGTGVGEEAPYTVKAFTSLVAHALVEALNKKKKENKKKKKRKEHLVLGVGEDGFDRFTHQLCVCVCVCARARVGVCSKHT
jgi:hypothetical protein